MERLPTGIEGFDAMVQGGLSVGSSIVLQGPPGQEKIRFALTFLAEGLKAGASGLVVISSQSPDAVLAELRSLGVNLDVVSKENRLRIVDWYSWSEETIHDIEDRGTVLRSSIDLTNLGVALSRAIAGLAGEKSRRAVIELLSPAMNVYEVTQVYAFAQSAKKKFDRYQFTSLVLLEKEMHSGSELTTLHQPFDGVIEIERSRSGDRIVRKIGVLHLRDTAPDPTFRVLEMTEAGMKVVRDAPKPSPPIPQMSGAVLESQEERARRLHLIMQIARERLKLNPRDADALFAMAAAQATLDDSKGGVQTLERLAELDPSYPGLWVLKTKLHARLGQADLARQSRLRAQQTEPGEAEVAGSTVPCPMCEAPVAVDATSCSNCGVKFASTRTLEDELDDLGHAAIQDMVVEELDAEGKREPAPAKPLSKVPPKPAAPPPKPAAKPSPKKGLTNGLVLERGAGRRAGMTNGLRGRTNGLRGRTNGLTNGMGRTNGLTNGIGRTNGLTNGVGRTNGLTNGVGRTNGLTNGLGRTNGITNGLGRTHGLTNGLGGVLPAGFQTSGLRGVMRNAGWKLYLIPLVTVALLLIPLFLVPEYQGPAYPIRIDGQFDDWAGVPRFTASAASANPNVDLTNVAVTDNVDYLSFYMEVRGVALEGSPMPSQVTDAFFVFIDTDRSLSTGYAIQGLGADRMIEIDGQGGQVTSASLMEFDANRDARDWGGWFKGTSAQAAVSGNRIEFEANWAGIVQPKATIRAAFAARSWDGQLDVADTTATSATPFVIVSQDTVAPQVVAGSQTPIARFRFQAVGGDITLSSLSISLAGSYGPGTLSSFALVDSGGTVRGRAPPIGTRVQFSPLSLAIPASGTLVLDLVPAVALDDGTTIGAFLDGPSDVALASGDAALRAPSRIPGSLAYVGAIPAGVRVDGAFVDWSNVTLDSIGDVSRGGPNDLDISRYAFQTSSGSVFFLATTVGTALNGTLVPAENPPASTNASSQPDADRDGVPDSVDPLPNDFNNDGIQDTATNGDYDGDGITDYGFLGGTDVWLNTTIPASFPAPYSGRTVRVYIGPVQRQVDRGEDVARFYLDQDGAAATGYTIGGIGADYLIEASGKEGRITSAIAERFNGTSPGQWAWASLGPAEAAKDRTRLEARIPGVAATNISRGFFELRGWSGAEDTGTATAPAQAPRFVAPPRTLAFNPSYPATNAVGNFTVGVQDIGGNQKWFFTNGATTGAGCNTNLAAGTLAGSSATSTTLTGSSSTICWFTPLDVPDTTSGNWETILDVDRTTNATKSLSPDSQGDSNAWTTSGCAQASAYQCVDETPNDGDLTYIFSTASTVTDSLFNIQNWTAAPAPPTPLSIINVVVEASCAKTLGNPVDVRIIIKSGGTTSVGATSQTCVNSATYQVWTDTWTTDPSDGLAWTLSDINALQVGVRDNDATTREVRVSHLLATITWVPVYSAEIDRCTASDCSTSTTLYGPTNGNTYGNDITFTTSSLGGQSLSGSERIRFKIALYVSGAASPGSVRVRYNGPNPSPGTDDSRGTSPSAPLPSTLTTVTVGTGGAAGDLYGFNVTGVGKVNENTGGFEDFVVGAPNVDFGGQNDRGAIYLFFGSSGWSPANVNGASANVVIYGEAAGDHFGWSIAAANDVNGDGFADILVGSPDAGQGKAYLVYGRSDWTAANGASIASVSSVVTIAGQNSGDKFGSSVAGLGNIDNSGNADFAVGAYTYGSSQGRVYLFYGDGSIPTKGVDADVRLDGAASGDKFGFSVAGAGNVNNDAYADIIVGAPGANKAYVYTLAINPVANGHLAADASSWSYSEVDPNGFDSGAWDNTGSSNADSSGAGSYKFTFTDTTSSQTVYFHGESLTVNTVSGKALLAQAGEQSTAVTSTVTAAASGDHLVIGTWTTPSLGITTLPAGTWTFTYNADAGSAITGHMDVHIYKRSSTGALTAIDGTDGQNTTDGVASSGTLTGTATDLTGTYSMASTSLATTDAIVINVYGHAVTVSTGVKTINFHYDASTAASRVVSTASFPEVRFFHVETATVNTVTDKQILTTAPDQGTTQSVSTTQANPGHYLLSEWTSPQLGITTIPAGDWHFLYWGSSSATSAHFDVHIYKRGSSGTTTSIDGTDGQDTTDGVAASATLSTTSAFYAGSINLASATLASTDAIVVKVYAHMVTVGGTKTTTFEFDATAKNSRMIYPGFSATDRLILTSASSFTSPPGTYSSVQYRFWFTSTVTSVGDATYKVKYEVRDGADSSTVATAYDSGSLTTAQAWGSHTGTVSGLSASTAYRVRIVLEIYNVHASQTPSITVNADDVELEFEILTTLTGSASTNFGWSVASAGNINADATPYKDVMVGAPDEGSGKVYIYYGSATFDATADVTISGAVSGDKFGYSVSPAGDATGDGIDDIVVGAPYNSNVATAAGAAYVFAGSASLAATLQTTDAAGVRYGETANDHLGWSVSASNPDGAGPTELLAGAPHYDAGANTDAGKVYVMKIPEFSDLLVPLLLAVLFPLLLTRGRRSRLWKIA